MKIAVYDCFSYPQIELIYKAGNFFYLIEFGCYQVDKKSGSSAKDIKMMRNRFG
jgi:hypothetical protein